MCYSVLCKSSTWYAYKRSNLFAFITLLIFYLAFLVLVLMLLLSLSTLLEPTVGRGNGGGIDNKPTMVERLMSGGDCPVGG
ncbi:hypothetical protein L2E82_50918 [Cichorium intybus]|nr:hypothetical protein L2E82_50918 [Cichorium intybus]